MGRLFIIVFNFLGALIISAFMSAHVSVTMDAPVIVDAGTEFRVKVTINKDDIQGFARFQQQLPAGLTATPENSANADFTFKNKKVRLIWLRLPNNQQITAVYKIKIDERLKGTFNIAGSFSYIENNDRKSANVLSHSITIIPSPNLEPDEIIDINEFEKRVIPDLSPNMAEPITCIRQKPYINTSGEIVVNILVSKENKEKFAKIEENISPGYTAVNISAQDAIFTSKNGEAKYLWMNLPMERHFIVTYNLIPDAGKTADNLTIHGQFSYMDGNETKTVNIEQKDIDLLSMNEAQITQLVRKGRITSQTQAFDKNNEIPVENTTPGNETDAAQQKNTNITSPDDNKNTTPDKDPIPEPIVKNNTKTPSYSSKQKKFALEPQQGVYYRVQIAAGHKPVNIKSYFRKFNLESDVKRESHEGWIKYSVGSFKVYKEARDYRVHIWNTTEIDDAFVSAYNEGKRITVQEALMIANQKWYQ